MEETKKTTEQNQEQEQKNQIQPIPLQNLMVGLLGSWADPLLEYLFKRGLAYPGSLSYILAPASLSKNEDFMNEVVKCCPTAFVEDFNEFEEKTTVSFSTQIIDIDNPLDIKVKNTDLLIDEKFTEFIDKMVVEITATSRIINFKFHLFDDPFDVIIF